MATPTTLMLGTSEKVYFMREDEETDGDFAGGLAEECALTITYQLAEGEDVETVVKEKAAAIGALHAEAQKSVRLARAERKANPEPKPVSHTAPPAQFKPPAETNTAPFQPNGKTEPSITGPQRLAIEEHFRRLRYTDQDVFAQINGRFAKNRLTDLSFRQASDLLSELQRMSVDPKRANNTKEPINVTAHGRRGAKRNGH